MNGSLKHISQDENYLKYEETEQMKKEMKV